MCVHRLNEAPDGQECFDSDEPSMHVNSAAQKKLYKSDLKYKPCFQQENTQFGQNSIFRGFWQWYVSHTSSLYYPKGMLNFALNSIHNTYVHVCIQFQGATHCANIHYRCW